MVARLLALSLIPLLLASCGGGSTSAPTASPTDMSASPAVSASATPLMTASPSPGGDIAYGGPGGLWLMNADGTNAHRIYGADDGTISHPEWSPDGARLAIVKVRYLTGSEPTPILLSDYQSVVVIDVQGRVLAEVQDAWRPHWSPDGTRLGILRGFGLGTEFSLSGLPAVFSVADQVVTEISPEILTMDAPRWSPDGKWIAYYAITDGLYVMNGNGTGQAKRVLGGAPATYYSAFTWADNDTVAVREKSDSAQMPSYVFVSPESGEIGRIINQQASSCGRDVEPGDGQPIAFSGGRFLAWPRQCQAPSGFWVYDRANPGASRNPRSIQIRDNGSIPALSASPDGRYIVYSGDGGGYYPFLRPTTPSPIATSATPLATGTPPLMWIVDLQTGSDVLVTQVTGVDAAWRP